ncbi:calcium incorporation protein MxaA [Ramlibacter sp. G-1-2-2]|uniref:Calcium incorporation protein MxaA n=1 Tax=Ramlibacter agri TaxID=2728837 RepID=A0A848H7X1_9BURK|nr:calcium incorporation protein MxaA [Ramlibacter agri]NML45571.1 calcium incorporation protein MxaA [Ramlibacter agri]
MRAALSAMLLALACAGALAQQRDAVVEQPRPFGYTVGDIATQRVLLPEGSTPAALPEAARASAWLERRPARIERGADGRRWLVVEYQVVNAPRALATITVPAWDLAGTPPLRVAATGISVGPLTAPVEAGQALPLRPDRPASAIATAPIERRLWLWSGVLAMALAAWLAYAAWNAWRDRNALPFGRALRELRGKAGVPMAAHVALHHAFDRTAGQVVQAGTLAALFQRAPWLQALRPQIERFYAQSAGLFFGSGLPADAVSPQALCRQLHRLERRHVA